MSLVPFFRPFPSFPPLFPNSRTTFSNDRQTNEKHSFGWVNASYVYGMQICNVHMRRALGTCTPYETYHKMTEHGM